MTSPPRSRLRKNPGDDLVVVGSSVLLLTLLAHDLVDTLHLLTFPIVLGTGKRVFSDLPVPLRFTLTGVTTSGSGVVLHSYAADAFEH